MAERIDKINLKLGQPNPYIDGPAEFLVKSLREQLLQVEEFKLIFGDFMDAYKRMDYPLVALPALRMYNETFTKDFESWFIDGDITLDVLFPANVRRDQLQQFQDTLSSALLQQFRRPTFFESMCELVPGLNELGKRFSVDKSLGFEWGEAIVPLTQIRLNFRIDLRKWDDYLESTNRTKDDPFKRTLGDLKLLAGVIQGLLDDESANIEIGTDINTEE